MKYHIMFFVLSSLFLNSGLLAHSGGHAPITQQKVLLIATATAQSFANIDPQLGFGEMGSSWANIGAESATIYQRGAGYYIVKVVNPNEDYALYILISEEGEVYDANTVGEFDGVN